MGWRGERLNFMIILWSRDTVNQIRLDMNELVNEKGRAIAQNNIRIKMVRYVLSNYPYASRTATCETAPQNAAYLVPDRLVPLGAYERIDIPARTTRPVWLTVDIPSQAEPGWYRGVIEVRSPDHVTALTLRIHIHNTVLPKPHDWNFRLDLWQNPWAPAHYFNVTPWSPAHKSILKNHLKQYADAGGKYITTYAVHSPWGDPTFTIDGTMIEWKKTRSGTWSFDYSIFDQYVELAMAVGIDKAISIYTPIPWGNRFRFLDEDGNYVYEYWEPSSQQFKAFWLAFLDDLKAHLKKKGWFKKTYLGINESELSQTLAAIKIIKEQTKEWKITYAGDWHRELDSLLDDYSCVYGKEPEPDKVAARSARGATSTFYVCCTPPHPNTLASSPPAEATWLGWYAAAHEYDGFLRWAYDQWPADPLRDARHVYWPAGDCFLVYPGDNSSVRYEKLREGIVDFEKIRILRRKAGQSTQSDVRSLMQRLDQHLQAFIGERVFEEEETRISLARGKMILDELTQRLENPKH